LLLTTKNGRISAGERVLARAKDAGESRKSFRGIRQLRQIGVPNLDFFS
jgi:hypothetical protein